MRPHRSLVKFPGLRAQMLDCERGQVGGGRDFLDNFAVRVRAIAAAHSNGLERVGIDPTHAEDRRLCLPVFIDIGDRVAGLIEDSDFSESHFFDANDIRPGYPIQMTDSAIGSAAQLGSW